MTKTKLRSYGFSITEEKFADCPSILARVLAREDGEDFPINPRSEGEDSIWDAPRKTDGLLLSGLEIRVWRGLDMKYVTGPRVCIDSARFIDVRLAKRALATMTRIERAIAKSQAREAGDVLMAIAKAIGATWFVDRVGPARGSFYSDEQWRFCPLIDARDRFRTLVDALRAPVEALDQERAAREREAV